MNDLDFMSKFKPETRCIKEFEYWIICIRSKHTTLGSSVILLKREISSVANMTPEESVEFPEVIKWYEEVCMKRFGAVKFNYMMMMMKDPFVHYHAFPRYDKEVNLFDIIWSDKNTLSNFSSVESLDERLLLKIKDYMKEEL